LTSPNLFSTRHRRSLALASLNRTCRDHSPDVSAALTTVAFDQSSPRWLGISDLITEPEGPIFISRQPIIARPKARQDQLALLSQCPNHMTVLGSVSQSVQLNEARTYTERMFHTLVLDRLSDTDARDAIARPIETTGSTLTFTDKAIEMIMEESKGYPFLIQYICKEVFDAWIGKMTVGAVPTISMDEIMAKLDQDFFAPRWNRATDRQQIFMQVIATLQNSNEEFSIQEITSASRDLLKKAFNPSHATQMLGHLAEKGLIYRNRRGSYCFAVPLLADFIQRQSWDAATRRVLAS
jgi:hypothetical protein